MKISIDKTKVMAFKGKEHIRSKICVYSKPVEQVSSFKYLGYNICCEKDIDVSTKILNCNRAMGIINQIFKPPLVQKYTRIKVYKTLATPAGYTKLDKKINTEILRELKINSMLEHVDQYRNNCKQHVQRMDRSRIPRQMMTYRPTGKRSLGRHPKRWRETVTGH
jgi:hypothetical protein